VLTIIALGSWIITFAVLLTQPLSHIGDDESLIDDFSELPPDVARSTVSHNRPNYTLKTDNPTAHLYQQRHQC
jgi:hypothetical protein